jgi:hypothetical protein
MASLAYAARMKRLGHGYFGVAVAAVLAGSKDAAIVRGPFKRIPSRIGEVSCADDVVRRAFSSR